MNLHLTLTLQDAQYHMQGSGGWMKKIEKKYQGVLMSGFAHIKHLPLIEDDLTVLCNEKSMEGILFLSYEMIPTLRLLLKATGR